MAAAVAACAHIRAWHRLQHPFALHPVYHLRRQCDGRRPLQKTWAALSRFRCVFSCSVGLRTGCVPCEMAKSGWNGQSSAAVPRRWRSNPNSRRHRYQPRNSITDGAIEFKLAWSIFQLALGRDHRSRNYPPSSYGPADCRKSWPRVWGSHNYYFRRPALRHPGYQLARATYIREIGFRSHRLGSIGAPNATRPKSR